jgi:hypothetical protein
MPTHEIRTTVRARRSKRGVAMVEAVAILPIFVVLWFTCLFAFNVGAKKIMANATSRADSWAYAMGNCADRSDPAKTPWPSGGWGNPTTSTDAFSANATQLLGGGGASGFDILGALTTVISNFLPGLGTSKSSIDHQQQTVSYVVPSDGVVSPGASSSHNIQYTSTLFCNEAPHDGNIKGVIGTIGNMLSSLL